MIPKQHISQASCCWPVGVLCSTNLKRIALILQAAYGLLAQSTVLAEEVSNAKTTMFGPNVYVFNTNMANAEIKRIAADIYGKMQTAHFASQGYALLFKPGTYFANCNVGFFTHVAGLASCTQTFTPAATNWKTLTMNGETGTVGEPAAADLTGAITGAGLVLVFATEDSGSFGNFRISRTAKN